MTEPRQTFELPSMPGIRRDGTLTDSDYYNDGQWVRFIRKDKGRPRKMGGYQLSATLLSGPVRGMLLWSHQFTTRIVLFSQYGIEYTDVDSNGLGGVASVITPAAYATNTTALWQYDKMYDAASGTNASILLATPLNTLQNIDDPTLAAVYWTPLNTPAAMVALTDTNAVSSGGVFCTVPYAVLLGNDGNITWSDVNAPQNYGGSGGNPGDAGSARITGTKLIKGLPMRTGSGPGGLIWSLDSVLRMDYVGGAAVFKFSHISTQSSVLSQNGIIEYDGVWFWVGQDRFFTSNGSQVVELENDMNKNWFFDNINMLYRQKVCCVKIPRWNEIWWFFPFGDETENTNAVIYNVYLKTWYDVALVRSSGAYQAPFQYPTMVSGTSDNQVSLTYTVAAGTVSINDYVRGTSGAEGSIQSITGAGPYVAIVTMVGITAFATGEGFVDVTSAATGTITLAKPLYSMYTHEKGLDATDASNAVAIPSWFETCNFGYPTGGTQVAAKQGMDTWMRLLRIEPDFVMGGEMTVNVITREFAQSPDIEQKPGGYVFNGETTHIDMREQGREIRVKFTSNTQGGFYEAGHNLVHLEPGDIRA